MQMRISRHEDGSIDLNIDRVQLRIIIGCIGYLCHGVRIRGFHTLIGASSLEAEKLVGELVAFRDAYDSGAIG
jgi:hypothetical protein